MSTTPDEDAPRPTRAQRVREAMAQPVTDGRTRTMLLLVGAAAAATLAPVPWSVGAVAALVAVSHELGRRK